MIDCYCCNRQVAIVRKVELRGMSIAPSEGFMSPDDPAYQSYTKNMTFRTAFICPACYHSLDSADGVAEIMGRPFSMAGKSLGDKAPTFDEAKYAEYQRREAEKLGLSE